MTGEKNTTQGTPFSQERQKQLYDIVCEVFQKELQTSNCFILPLVGQRAGKILRENGFLRVNRETFQSAPDYFVIGYNAKNAMAISLVGFPRDKSFHTDRIVVPPRTENRSQGVLRDQDQKQLAEIILEVFKNSHRDGRVFLATVGNKAGKKIADAGLGRVSIELFKAADSYFEVLQDKNGAYQIAFRKECGYAFPGAPDSSVQEAESLPPRDTGEFQEWLFEQLLKDFQKNEIPFKTVGQYLESNRIELPSQFSSMEELFERMAEQYGSVIRDRGEGTSEERFLVLRKPFPVPDYVRSEVEAIVTECFLTKQLIANSEIGAELKKRGIRFKDYNYMDLTSFLRSFSDIFIIVPRMMPKNNKVIVYIRITPHFLRTHEFRTERVEHPAPVQKSSVFPERISELYASGDYQRVIEQANLREAIKYTDAEMWNCIVQSYWKVNGREDFPELSPWERAVIDFHHLAEVITDKLLAGYGLPESSFSRIKGYVAEHALQPLRFSTQGLHISTLCSEDNPLAEVFFQLGLAARLPTDKTHCLRLLTLYYAKYQPALVLPAWEKYVEKNMNSAGMAATIGTLFNEGKIELVDALTEQYLVYREASDGVGLYYTYARRLLGKDDAALVPLTPLEPSRAVQLVSVVLDWAFVRRNPELLLEVVDNCLRAPEEYLSISSLENLLRSRKEHLEAFREELFQGASTRQRQSWNVYSYLVSSGLLASTPQWESLRSCVRDEYLVQLRECTAEEKESAIEAGLELFPTQPEFVEALVCQIRETGADVDALEAVVAALAARGEYQQVIALYEGERTLKLGEKEWFLRRLSDCCLRQGEGDKFLETELAIMELPEMLRQRREEGFSRLIDDLYIAFISRSLTRAGAEPVERLRRLFENYFCPTALFHSFCVVQMGLAMLSCDVPMLGLLFSFVGEWEHETEFLSLCEQILQNNGQAYHSRLGDLQRTFEYLLTQEDPETIWRVLNRTAKMVLSSGEEKLFNQIRTEGIQKVEPEKLIRTLIALCSRVQSWKLLSQYSNKTKKYALNFVANLFWFWRFGDTAYAMENCIHALDRMTDNPLPRNFLLLCLSAWNTDVGEGIVNFQKAVLNHVIRCNSFVQASGEVMDALFGMVSDKQKVSLNVFLLALEAARQSHSFERFCEVFLKDSDDRSAVVISDVGVYLRLCTAFAWSADDKTFFQWKDKIEALRNEIGTHNLDAKGKYALLWTDQLLSRERGSVSGDSFAEASMELLYQYPDAPRADVVNKWITKQATKELPDYVLMRNWVNTFGTANIISFAENAIRNYTVKHPVSSATANHRAVYQLRHFLAEKSVYYYEKKYQRSSIDFLRRCMTYYALKKLMKDSAPIPASVREKMRKELEGSNDYPAYLNFVNRTDELWSAGGSPEVKEDLIYSGITNFWDVVLDQWVRTPPALDEIREEADNFLKAVDIRPLRRRLLQMYVYSRIAVLGTGVEDVDSVLRQRDVAHYRSLFESGALVPEEHQGKLLQLIRKLQPALLPIVQKTELVQDEEQKVSRLLGILLALVNKDCSALRTNLHYAEETVLREAVLPTAAAIQNSRDLREMLLQMAFQCDEFTSQLLTNEAIVASIGRADAALFLCLFNVQQKDFSAAERLLAQVSEAATDYAVLYERLAAAIADKGESELDPAELSITVRSRETLPSFSFVRQINPENANFSQLVSDFYTEGLHDSKGRQILAGKIYASMVNGTSYSDALKFLFDWGFVAMEATYDIEKKEEYLLEMVEQMDQLPNLDSYKGQFVRQFSFLLQELDFSLFIRSFQRICQCHKLLYNRFRPYENCDCYARLFVLMEQLIGLGKEGSDPSEAMPVLDQIKAQVIDVHLKYPQNRFANSCIGYVDRFAQQIRARGIFEVKILNVDKRFDDVIFYCVRNVGFELVSDVVLTFSVSNHPEATEQVSTGSLMPMGLRPNQVYAGEYKPNTDFAPDEVVECSISVEYSVVDEDGVRKIRQYVAIDPSTAGRLRHETPSDYCYHKDGGAGYITAYITQPSDFVGREEDLNKILGKALHGQNVLLYGTNGTGKSSILQYLFSKALPDCYAGTEETVDGSGASLRPGHLFVAAPMKFDEGCTEKTVITSLVSAICDDLTFRAFLRHCADPLDVDTVAMVAEEWESRSDKLFDEEGRCTNTELIRRYLVTIDGALYHSNIDVYILIDQFERVISSPLIDSRHMLFLGDLVRRKIRFIIAGSNYLLEEVSVEKNQAGAETAWPIIFSRGFDERIKIGNMLWDDFVLLITKKSALNNGELVYTDDALEYLWQYTNGHAFYSCLLANRTLDILSQRRVHRRYIYPSDVFFALYQAGKYLPGGKTDREKEKAIKSQIFQDFSDNTPIKYVGKTLAQMQSEGERRISYRRLRDYIVSHRPDLFSQYHYALNVLLARDFISYEELDVHSGDLNGDDADSSLVMREYYFTSDLYLEHFASVDVPELSDEERYALERKNRSIDELIADLRTRDYKAQDISKIREAVKDIVGESGNQYVTIQRQFNDQSTDRSIGTQYNLQIHAKTINAFSTLLSGQSTPDQFAAAFASLPGTQAYLGEANQRVLALQQEISACLDEDGEPMCDDPEEYDQVVQDIESKYEELEGIVLPAAEEKVRDIAAAISMDDFLCVNEKRWQELLGIGAAEVKKLKALPAQYSAPLGFAVTIHNLFQRIYENSLKNDNVSPEELDYCPVAILYCKLVEAMLKGEHIQIYRRCFGNQPLDSRNPKSPLFSEVEPESKLLSIGVFLSCLTTVNVNRINDKESYARLNRMRFLKRQEIKNLSSRSNTKSAQWYEHADGLPVVAATRNKSAHDVKPITRERFDWLVEVLFGGGELLRIWELSHSG